MHIRFTSEDWNRIEQDWEAYWNFQQQRPMVLIQCQDPRAAVNKERCSCVAQYPAEVTAQKIIELETRFLEAFDFVGDAFPKFFLNFGPGSAAAYFGSPVTAALDTVWFERISDNLAAIEEKIILDRDNLWFQRTHAVLDAALKKWSDQVQVTVSDIGGNLDILASLRGSNELLIDLYDNPELVEKLTHQITHLWLELYRLEADKILSTCKRSASWGPFLSRGYTYTLQSDFSYMISPSMFERFVVPDLTACCEVITDSFYHLDGPGQLVHLDALLSIEKLKGIQWLPGTGQKPPEQWPEVLKKIKDHDKLNQVYVSPEGAREIKQKLGGEGFVFFIETHQSPLTVDQAKRLYDQLTV